MADGACCTPREQQAGSTGSGKGSEAPGEFNGNAESSVVGATSTDRASTLLRPSSDGTRLDIRPLIGRPAYLGGLTHPSQLDSLG